VTVFGSSLNHYKDATLIFLDDGQRAAGRLQQRGQFRLDESMLLARIANMTERWSHIKSSAGLTLEKDVVAA
jgi:hypothetical protein